MELHFRQQNVRAQPLLRCLTLSMFPQNYVSQDPGVNFGAQGSIWEALELIILIFCIVFDHVCKDFVALFHSILPANSLSLAWTSSVHLLRNYFFLGFRCCSKQFWRRAPGHVTTCASAGFAKRKQYAGVPNPISVLNPSPVLWTKFLLLRVVWSC